MSRKYSEAWGVLKGSLRLEIVAPRAWHVRIHNGIRKERYKDLAHSLFLAEENLFERMTLTQDGETMIYILNRKPRTSIELSDLF